MTPERKAYANKRVARLMGKINSLTFNINQAAVPPVSDHK